MPKCLRVHVLRTEGGRLTKGKKAAIGTAAALIGIAGLKAAGDYARRDPLDEQTIEARKEAWRRVHERRRINWDNSTTKKVQDIHAAALNRARHHDTEGFYDAETW